MKVTVIKPAFFNGSLLREGAVVDEPEGTQASWFAAEAKAVKPAKPAKDAPRALSQAGKEEAKTFIQAHSDKSDKSDLA